MGNAIVKQEMNLSAWQMIREAAPVMHRSRLFGVATEEQAVAIMAKGYELGLGFTTSFEFITVIEGKPTLIPRGALALAYQSGLLEEFKVREIADSKGQPYACEVSGRRKGGALYTCKFTLDDANRAGLIKDKSGWTKYPANMLKWRAIGYWMDVVMPDITGGMKRADEFGAMVDAGGDVLPTSATQAAVIDAVYEPLPTLDDLIAKYGAEAVLNANNGNLPVTQDELDSLAVVLEGVE